MKKSNNGFGLVVLLLLILFLGLAITVGYITFNKQKTKTNNEVNPKTTNQQQTKPLPESEVKDQKETIPDGFKQYKNDKVGVSFLYPKDWMEVTLSSSETDSGSILKIVSPHQKQNHEEYLGQPPTYSEGPNDSDLIVSRWDSINNAGARGGSYLGEQASYKNLEEFLTNKNSAKVKIGDLTINDQKAYEVIIGGFSSYYGVMFEKPDGSIFEFMFVNIVDKSGVDNTTKTIVNSIKLY